MMPIYPVPTTVEMVKSLAQNAVGTLGLSVEPAVATVRNPVPIVAVMGKTVVAIVTTRGNKPVRNVKEDSHLGKISVRTVAAADRWVAAPRRRHVQVVTVMVN